MDRFNQAGTRGLEASDATAMEFGSCSPHTNVRAAWFTLAIDIYRTHEGNLDAAQTDRKRASAVRRLKAARPAIQHMLRDADLEGEDRAYLARLLTRIDRYFIQVPPDRQAA